MVRHTVTAQGVDLGGAAQPGLGATSVSAATSMFSGIVQCQVPRGAGNVW